LIANLGHNSFSCYNPEILPIGYVTYKEYFLEMPDESRLSWTSGLSAYVDKFNVVPSFEFLSEFSNFLEYCKTTYLKAADSLKDYLLEHPLDLGMQDKSHSMRF
jgi:hypothetical protein